MQKQNNMAMVVSGLMRAGLNANQARIMAAEIGRENGFRDEYLFGYHTDDANSATNVGMLSWQGSRGKAIERELKAAGLIKNGEIVRGQASIDVMSRFLVNEIQNNPSYARTKKEFLNNPNVDYAKGAEVLGKNFIRWRYDDPKYASGHTNRDTFYKQLGGVMEGVGDVQAEPQMPAATTTAPANLDSVFSDFDPSKIGGNQLAVLKGSVGLVAPDTPTENSMFSGIASMGLNGELEAIYAEAAKAIASAKDSIESRPMIQSSNPLRDELSSLFDKIKL